MSDKLSSRRSRKSPPQCTVCAKQVDEEVDLRLTISDTSSNSEAEHWWHEPCWEIGTDEITIQLRRRVDPRGTMVTHSVDADRINSVIVSGNQDSDEEFLRQMADHDARAMAETSDGSDKVPHSESAAQWTPDFNYPWLRDADDR